MPTLAEHAANLRTGMTMACGEGKTLDEDKSLGVLLGLAAAECARTGRNLTDYTNADDIRGLAADALMRDADRAWSAWDAAGQPVPVTE